MHCLEAGRSRRRDCREHSWRSGGRHGRHEEGKALDSGDGERHRDAERGGKGGQHEESDGLDEVQHFLVQETAPLAHEVSVVGVPGEGVEGGKAFAREDEVHFPVRCRLGLRWTARLGALWRRVSLLHELRSRWTRRRQNGRVAVGVEGLMVRVGVAVEEVEGEEEDGGSDQNWTDKRSEIPAVSVEIVARMVAMGSLGDGGAGYGDGAEMVISGDAVGRCVHLRPGTEVPAIAKLTHPEDRRVERTVFESRI